MTPEQTLTAAAERLRDLLLPIATGIRTCVRALTGDPNPTATPADVARQILGDQP